MSNYRKLREWMEHWLKTQEHEFLETLKTKPVIFANLTPEEYERFEKARIETTGSSGKGGRPEDYKGLAPFIASYFYEIPKALHALGWKHSHISEHNGQMVIGAEPAPSDSLITSLQQARPTTFNSPILGIGGPLKEPAPMLDLQPLKDVCDRDWKDETPQQIIAIAAIAQARDRQWGIALAEHDIAISATYPGGVEADTSAHDATIYKKALETIESKCLSQARICSLENERLTLQGKDAKSRYWEGRSDAFQDCVAFVRALATKEAGKS